ncbi:unnamed protein product, partial [Ascophyllum nodosum]
MWIAFVVLVWYAHEFFQSIISSSLYNITWAKLPKDPCWAYPKFLTNTSVVIRKKKKKETELIQTFPGNCSAWVLLNAIQP